MQTRALLALAEDSWQALEDRLSVRWRSARARPPVQRISVWDDLRSFGYGHRSSRPRTCATGWRPLAVSGDLEAMAAASDARRPIDPLGHVGRRDARQDRIG